VLAPTTLSICCVYILQMGSKNWGVVVLTFALLLLAAILHFYLLRWWMKHH
jgi:hypothetical protein